MAAEPKSEQEVLAQFQQLVEEREQLTNASIERQQEVAEHDLVIKTLDPLDADRKCFRLVGEVLVERTVADVLPAVKKNRENLSTLVTMYEKQLAAKVKELLAYQERYNIRIKGEGDGGAGDAGAAQQRPGGGGQGVLVGS
ncbi:putative prefoldin subunit 2 [Chlorella vulgaris]